VVVIFNCAGAMVRVRFTVAVCTGELESVTLKLSGVALTAEFGVPLIRPVDGANERPDGNVPTVNCQVYGPVPPEAASAWEYAAPTCPSGSAVVVMVSPGPVMVSVKLALAVWAGEPESVSLNVSGVALTIALGVPLICPVVALSARPLGSVPAVSCQEYGVVPPVAARVCEYAVPITPFGSEVVVMMNAPGMMVNVRLAVAVCAGEPESVTLKVSGVALAMAVGVPLIRPEEAFNVNPAGKVPPVSCQVYAPDPPEARKVCEYGVFTVPLGRDVVRMPNAEVTDTFPVVPVKFWADAVMVAVPGFTPVICAPVVGVVAPVSINTLGVTVTMFGSLVVSVMVTPPCGAAAARLTGYGTDWPGATAVLAGSTMVPATPTVTFTVPLL
jgi:hypothetical protein